MSFRAKLVATHAANATIAPTERSMPPVTMTKVMPTAMMPMTEICLSMLVRLDMVRNTLELNDSTTNSATNATYTPYLPRKSPIQLNFPLGSIDVHFIRPYPSRR